MKNINLKNWIIDGNNASVSLMNLYANVSVLKNDDYIFYELTVTENNMKSINLKFYSLEDVVFFVEDNIKKCFTNQEVMDKYQNMKDEGLFSFPGGIKTPKGNTISLTPDEVDAVLFDYYAKEKSYRVSINEEHYINADGEHDIAFYMTKHINNNGIKKDFKYMLSKTDIKKALLDYINYYNYELADDDYKINYFKDGDFHYDGIILNVKEKEKPKVLKKLIKE